MSKTVTAFPGDFGPSNERRGLRDHSMALEFVKEFPIGTVISYETFGDFILKHQETFKIDVPPSDTDKQSDQWKAYVQRRHEIRRRLNASGNHSRMGENAFVIEAIGQDSLTVSSPQLSIALLNPGIKVDRVAKRNIRQLQRLMQSTHWSGLAPDIKAEVRTLYQTTKDFAATWNLQADQLDSRYASLKQLIGQESEIDKQLLLNMGENEEENNE